MAARIYWNPDWIFLSDSGPKFSTKLEIFYHIWLLRFSNILIANVYHTLLFTTEFSAWNLLKPRHKIFYKTRRLFSFWTFILKLLYQSHLLRFSYANIEFVFIRFDLLNYCTTIIRMYYDSRLLQFTTVQNKNILSDSAVKLLRFKLFYQTRRFKFSNMVMFY